MRRNARGSIFRPDTPFVHYIALIVIRAQLFKQRVEIQGAAARLVAMVIRNMHMTEQVAVVMQRLRQVIFFDIHVIEIADNLYMFKIVFDDVTAGIGEGVDHMILIAV